MCDWTQAALPGCGLSLLEKTNAVVDLLRSWEKKARECEGSTGFWGVDDGGIAAAAARQLCELAGVGVGWHYNSTEVDVPEVCQFVRTWHPDTIWEERRSGFLDAALQEEGVLLRRGTWCQRQFKSWGGAGRLKLMSWRWEQTGRLPVFWGSLRVFGGTTLRAVDVINSWVINPLRGWTKAEVAEFVAQRSLRFCCAEFGSDEELGCAGCPMRGREALRWDFARWPNIGLAWGRAFDRLWKRKSGKVLTLKGEKGELHAGIAGIRSAEALFGWWIGVAGRAGHGGCAGGWAG